MAVNKKWSYGDFSGKTWKHLDPKEFNDSEIHCSAFGISNTPRADVFPDGMTGVVFYHCNLDNCLVPTGNTIMPDCCTNQHKRQKDKEQWIVDEQNNPIEPLKKARFEKYNLSTDPKDIPQEEVKISPVVVEQKEELKLEIEGV